MEPDAYHPTQEELKSHTREFGGEANRVNTLTGHSDRLAEVINRLIPIIDRIDRSSPNNNGNNGQPQPQGSTDWAYAGIDTARDHKMLGGVLTQLEHSMVKLEGAVMLIEPAILRLESRIARVEAMLVSRLHRAA